MLGRKREGQHPLFASKLNPIFASKSFKKYHFQRAGKKRRIETDSVVPYMFKVNIREG